VHGHWHVGEDIGKGVGKCSAGAFVHGRGLGHWREHRQGRWRMECRGIGECEGLGALVRALAGALASVLHGHWHRQGHRGFGEAKGARPVKTPQGTDEGNRKAAHKALELVHWQEHWQGHQGTGEGNREAAHKNLEPPFPGRMPSSSCAAQLGPSWHLATAQQVHDKTGTRQASKP